MAKSNKETLEILADKKLVKRIKRAEADMQKGNLKTLEEVEKDLRKIHIK